MLIRCWLPPESVPAWSSAAVLEGGLREHLGDGRLDVVDLLEPREQPQVLGDGEPPVERRLLGDEADLPPRQVRPRPASGSRIPARIESSVVLPAPLGPMTASSSPGRGGEADVAQRRPVAEALAQARAPRSRRRACRGGGRGEVGSIA